MTRQSRIAAGGDVAGGDIVRQQITILTSPEPLLLKRLYERYQSDVETQNTTDTLIEELRAYIPDDDPESLQRDLERKLREAGREDLVRQARLYKEMFRQKIEKYRLFPAAQAIYAYLLGEILTRFDAYVKPAIDDGADAREIGRLVHESIVQFIIQTIPESEPTCDHPSLYGMIYFLTGNCFIEWH
jgi:hypothetical protein